MALARFLSPEGFGLYGFIMASVAILTVPAAFGMPSLIVRETARSLTENRPIRIWKLWSWASRVGVIASVGAIAIGIPWALVNVEAGQLRVWAWGGALLPVLVFSYLRSAAIRGLGHTLLGQIPETLLRPTATVIIVLIYAYFVGPQFDTEFAMIASLCGTFISFVAGLFILLQVAPVRPSNKISSTAPELQKSWFFAALTMGLANGVQVLGANTDILFLGVLTTNAEVGLYKIALSGGSLVVFGFQAVNTVMMPQVAAQYHSGDIQALKSAIRYAARLVFIFTLFTVLALLVFGQSLIVILFGSSYAGAYSTLLIIGAGHLASALFGSVVMLLSMTGHERETLIGAIAFAIMNIILNSVLVPIFGPEGAASATAASLIALNFYLWVIVRRKLGVNTLAFGKM